MEPKQVGILAEYVPALDGIWPSTECEDWHFRHGLIRGPFY